MDDKTARKLKDDADIATLRATISFMGLSALYTEMQTAGALRPQARRSNRRFIDFGVEEARFPERVKAHVRSMIPAQFSRRPPIGKP